jgi:hypothetical protein
MRIGISGAVRLFGLIAAGIFLTNAAVAVFSLAQLRVGGELYTQIADGKDLIGDILPPPEYVIEAYLEATLAKNNPASVKVQRAAIEKLHKDFTDRRKFWSEADLPVVIKQDLETAAKAAEPFWTTVENGLLQALEKGDSAKAQADYEQAQNYYALHRAAIDHLVEDTNAFNANLEQTAASHNRFFSLLLYATSAIGLLIIVLGSAGIVRWVVRPHDRCDACAGAWGVEHQRAVPATARRNWRHGGFGADLQGCLYRKMPDGNGGRKTKWRGRGRTGSHRSDESGDPTSIENGHGGIGDGARKSVKWQSNQPPRSSL